MFKWKDKYSCNIESIDLQHKQLFKLGNELYELIKNNKNHDNYDQIQQILIELKDYTVYHFEYEEKLMKEYGYDDLENQEIEHKAFLDKILNIEIKDIDEDQLNVMMDMMMFVANWIEKHIVKSDMKYKEFFNDKGVY